MSDGFHLVAIQCLGRPGFDGDPVIGTFIAGGDPVLGTFIAGVDPAPGTPVIWGAVHRAKDLGVGLLLRLWFSTSRAVQVVDDLQHLLPTSDFRLLTSVRFLTSVRLLTSVLQFFLGTFRRSVHNTKGANSFSEMGA